MPAESSRCANNACQEIIELYGLACAAAQALQTADKRQGGTVHQNGAQRVGIAQTCTHSWKRTACLYGRDITIFSVLTALLAENLRLHACSEGEQPVETYMAPPWSQEKGFGFLVRMQTYIRRQPQWQRPDGYTRFRSLSLQRRYTSPSFNSGFPKAGPTGFHRFFLGNLGKVIFCYAAGVYSAPLESKLHAMRAFLLARATLVRFFPRLSNSATSHSFCWEEPPCLAKDWSTALAPWISSVRV